MSCGRINEAILIIINGSFLFIKTAIKLFLSVSGLDPNAGGLQVTSDGRRKVIDRIDASGAGDVDMSKIVEAKDGELRGQSNKYMIASEVYI